MAHLASKRARKQVAHEKALPVNAVLEMFQKLVEPPPPYPGNGRGSKATRANRKLKPPPNCTSATLLFDRPSSLPVGHPKSDKPTISLELTFGPPRDDHLPVVLPSSSKSRKQTRLPPGAKANDLLEFIEPLLGMNQPKPAAETPKSKKHQKHQKNQNNQKPEPEVCPVEREAERMWTSMSDKMCPCRKTSILEALQKDKELLEQRNTHLKAQIMAYHTYGDLMMEHLEKRDLGVVLVVSEGDDGKPKLKFQLEKRTTGEGETGENARRTLFYKDAERNSNVYL